MKINGKPVLRYWFGFIVVLSLAACGSHDDSPDPDPGMMPDPGSPPSGGGNVDFNAFVIDQIAITSDTAEPVAVDDTDFEFSDDPGAFDSLMQ